jgi:P4 family phage/plasmid primase-like protien
VIIVANKAFEALQQCPLGFGVRKPTPKPIAEYIIEREGPDAFARDPGGHLYLCRNGVFGRADQAIKEWVDAICVAQLAKEQWRSGLAKEAIESLLVHATELWDRPQDPLEVEKTIPPHLICVRNGLLDVDTLELIPHEKHRPTDWLSLTQLAIIYEPKAKCPAWEMLCASWFPEDAYANGLPWKILALLMLPLTIHQMAILLISFVEGGTGKSRFIAALRAFLGFLNVSNMALRTIEEERFARASLYGMLANLCADLPGRVLEHSNYFKQIAAGDRIDGDHKYKDRFFFDAVARLLFSSNSFPMSKDASDAFYDRWLLIPFLTVFRNQVNEISALKIDARITQPSELSGALNNALKYIAEVRDPKTFKENLPQSCKDANAEFRRTADPFRMFCDSQITQGSYVIKEELRAPITNIVIGKDRRRSRRRHLQLN